MVETIPKSLFYKGFSRVILLNFTDSGTIVMIWHGLRMNDLVDNLFKTGVIISTTPAYSNGLAISV